MSQIELSVAIIFKNEIRCLERCLKSLQPLRERFSAEIVMADTGSDDGSRNLAERYADVLFDFPWINDFSAARNAVLERCSGEWVLVIDCDEWLDKSAPEELEQILRGDAAKNCDGVSVLVRNYKSYTCDQDYSDFPITRLARLASGPRYSGRIHEALVLEGRPMVKYQSGLVLHHDGYAAINTKTEAGQEKLRRNMKLLRTEVAENPEDLQRWVQIMDSCGAEPDCMELVNQAARLVEERKPGWHCCGAPILRRAAQHAYNHMLPETLLWAEKARSLFPKSYFTRVDVNRIELYYHLRNNDIAACIAPGEACLQGIAALRREKQIPEELGVAVLEGMTRDVEETIRVLVADIHSMLGHASRALAYFEKVNWSALDAENVSRALEAVARLRQETDTNELIRKIWQSVRPAAGETEQHAALARAFLAFGRASFSTPEPAEGQRPVWRTFLPLRGECVLGDYAAVMAAQTPEEADAALAAIEDLTALPPAVFVHALKTGAAFPLPGRELTVEQSDAMAAMLAEDKPFLREASLFAADAFENTADLLWARSLALTALKANDWAADEEPMALLRSFVKVESVFLPLCYAETALREPWLLPPMQRFALHLTSAFAVLFPDAVSPSFPPTGERSVRGALAELKLAAVAAPQQKAAVDAVLDSI